MECHTCGRPYDDSFPDWTICGECYRLQCMETHGDDVYIDCLGIAWTPEDLEEAGGIEEVARLANEARA